MKTFIKGTKIKAGKICSVIARREKCTNNEALNLIKDELNEAVDFVVAGEFQLASDHLESSLRIEPDIIESFLFQFIRK